MSFTARTLASALAGAGMVSAHGYVKDIIVNGVQYAGYDVTSAPYQADPPTVVGWSSTATDLGFVSPDAFGSPDIICHRDSTNAGGHATVAAGDSIFIEWNTWPDSHKGPVLDYLARCGSSGCESVDKTTLEFFKISEGGLVDGSSAPGTYAADELLANGIGWMVKIPETIAPGAYVLRHEIIALHSAGQENGAQAYPQCFNLMVTGSGTAEPAGVLGTELYTATDEGILFNIYSTLDDYPIPGPALIEGASSVEQSSSAATSTATATVGDASVPEPTTTNAETQPTTAPAEPTATDVAPAPSATTTEAAEVPAPTSTTPEQPEQTKPATCSGSRKHKRSSKKSRKVRRHARDVKSRNVAAIRN